LAEIEFSLYLTYFSENRWEHLTDTCVALTMQAGCLPPREILIWPTNALHSRHSRSPCTVYYLYFPSYCDYSIPIPGFTDKQTFAHHFVFPPSATFNISVAFAFNKLARTFTSLLNQKTLINPNYFISQRAMLLPGSSKDRNRKVIPPGPVSFSNEEFGQWTGD
jgi:hypothetical protein